MATVYLSLTFTGEHAEDTRITIADWRASSAYDNFSEAGEDLVGSLVSPDEFKPVSRLAATAGTGSDDGDEAILRFFSWGEEEFGLGFGVSSYTSDFYSELATFLAERNVEWSWDVEVIISSLINSRLEGRVKVVEKEGLAWDLTEDSEDTEAEGAHEFLSPSVLRELRKGSLPSADARALRLRSGISRDFVDDFLFGDWEAVQRVELGREARISDEVWKAEDDELDQIFDGQPIVSIDEVYYPLGIFVEDDSSQ